MSGYARVATQLGAAVSGSDRADSAGLRALAALGVEVHVGHAAANVPAGEGVEVVHSTAIPIDNPERAAARERALPDLPRAELLAQLSALKRTIAVAGAHGKTTTTSMTAHVLLRCGLEPAYLVGGALTTTGLNADWGAGEWLVVEADESDRSMLALHVDVAVVTNVELDHHATYGSLAEVREVFRTLLAGAPQAVLWDRPDVLALRGDAPHVAFDVPRPGSTAAARASSGAGTPCACRPGAHNARNARRALEACRAGRRRPARPRAALADFAGAGRRFQAWGPRAAARA
jgi:UDP-N-acetylmuramate--alanine ligase